MRRFRTTKTNLRALGISPRQLGTSPRQLAKLDPAEKKRVLKEARIKRASVKERMVGLTPAEVKALSRSGHSSLRNFNELTPASVAMATETLLRQPVSPSADNIVDEFVAN
ncbi:hypothetical protein KAR91_32415 [Candidatus Pacearchaeota archaeon]|nr:hypothetical protein [Candidatus Pacearchaeota archaeon]